MSDEKCSCAGCLITNSGNGYQPCHNQTIPDCRGAIEFGSACGKCPKCISLAKPCKIEVVCDSIAEKLDELADLSEYWKKNRCKGRTPTAIRAAMVMLINEVAFNNIHSKPAAPPKTRKISN